jgi:hypothetical protein
MYVNSVCTKSHDFNFSCILCSVRIYFTNINVAASRNIAGKEKLVKLRIQWYGQEDSFNRRALQKLCKKTHLHKYLYQGLNCTHYQHLLTCSRQGNKHVSAVLIT